MNTHTYLVSVTGSTNFHDSFTACFQYSTAAKGHKLAEELIKASEEWNYKLGTKCTTASDAEPIHMNRVVITSVFDCGEDET